MLQHSVDLEIATETGKASLFEWKKYRLLLLFVLTFCNCLMFRGWNS
ncbi:tail fiber assembly protein [Photorhabdus bodei]|nr:tail fiber assembly protein [Photorhabdus bodei]